MQEARFIQYVKSLENSYGANINIDFESHTVDIDCPEDIRYKIAEELNEFFGDFVE